MLTDGQPMGCTDSGPPERYSEYALSRALDAVNAIKALVRHVVDQDCTPEHVVGLAETEMIEHCIPSSMRFEMTWARWHYRSR